MRPSDDASNTRRKITGFAFLLLVAGGLSSLTWASPALRLLDSLLPGGAKALLPSQGWRIYTVGDSMPRFDPRSWKLRIDGLVVKPRELGYGDLLRLRRAEQTSDFHCVTGWSVRNVRWAGVRFHDLLALARPLPQAHALRFVSAAFGVALPRFRRRRRRRRERSGEGL